MHGITVHQKVSRQKIMWLPEGSTVLLEVVWENVICLLPSAVVGEKISNNQPMSRRGKCEEMSL